MGGTQSSDSPELEPEAGDLIEIFRGIYRHWAVYVGGTDKEVIHLTVPDGALGVSASNAVAVHTTNGEVKKEPLSVVVAGGKYRVNRKYDQKYKCKPVEKIVHDAEAKVGERVPYHLLRKNCEHFATELRHGVDKSEQVETGLTVGGAVIGSMVGIAGVMLSGFYIHKALKRRQDEEYQ